MATDPDEHAGLVEAYAASVGLPRPQARDIDRYLNEDLDDLDAIELAGIAVEVARYAYYLQDLVNQKQVVIETCDFEIKRLVGRRAPGYDAFKFEDKLMLAALDNDVTRRLLEVRQNAHLFVVRTRSLDERLAAISHRIDSLAYKRSRNG